MRDLRGILIRGSEKVIGHYQYLLATATSEQERARFRERIDDERKLLATLQDFDQPLRAA